MKLALIALLALSTHANAETIRVYRQRSIQSPKSARSLFTGEPLTWTSPGEPLGEIQLGDATLQGIVAKYREEPWSSFYGDVETFVLQDGKGRFYVAHYEYSKGPEGRKVLARGSRAAIIRLRKVVGRKGLFVGSPYDGSNVTDEVFLKKLRTVAPK